MTNFWYGIPALILLIGIPIFFLNATWKMEFVFFTVAVPCALFLIGVCLVLTTFDVPMILLGAVAIGVSAFWLSAVIPVIIDSYREGRT